MRHAYVTLIGRTYIFVHCLRVTLGHCEGSLPRFAPPHDPAQVVLFDSLARLVVELELQADSVQSPAVYEGQHLCETPKR